MSILEAVILVIVVLSIRNATAWTTPYSSAPLSRKTPAKHLFSRILTNEGKIGSDVTTDATSTTNADEMRPHLVFPGGGIFFYWQAGAVTYLREQGYNLSETIATGASAGALTATLASTNVDFYKATELALDMAGKAGVWDRKQGLQGIWGPMIKDWLDELLPDDSLSLIDNGRLTLLVTPVPTFGKTRVQSFADRQELIDCNMASVHLPWFLDGQLTTTFRNQVCIDGSFLASTSDYVGAPSPLKPKTLVLDYNRDPAYQNRGMMDFVTALSPEGIWGMLEDGKKYAKYLEDQGAFDHFRKQ